MKMADRIRWPTGEAGDQMRAAFAAQNGGLPIQDTLLVGVDGLFLPAELAPDPADRPAAILTVDMGGRDGWTAVMMPFDRVALAPPGAPIPLVEGDLTGLPLGRLVAWQGPGRAIYPPPGDPTDQDDPAAPAHDG
jgi:hypothetical protein